MGQVTPVFVCGMGRSGTTNAVRILNAHPSVMLNGEIALSVLKPFFALLDSIDQSFGKSDQSREEWEARKAEYIFESFGYLSKSGRGRFDNATGAFFRGHKTPRLEIIFEQYEAHFRNSGPAPRYFFCARNPFDCWRSYRVMPWSGYGNVDDFLRDYLLSFECLEKMREDIGARVAVINLDEVKESPDLFKFYAEKLFAPLGLDLPERSMKRVEKIITDRKSTKAPALSEADKKAIAIRRGIPQILETYFPRLISSSH